MHNDPVDRVRTKTFFSEKRKMSTPVQPMVVPCDELRTLRAMSQLVKLFESESRVCLRPCNIDSHGGKAINEARAATMRWAASMVESSITKLFAEDEAQRHTSAGWRG